MIRFLSGEGLSISELQVYKDKGHPFFRTAHIGNLNLVTIFLARMGFPVYLHEDIPGDFPSYLPAYVIHSGKSHRVFNDSQLNTPLLWRQSEVPMQFLKFFSSEKTVGLLDNSIDLHFHSSRRISRNFYTWSMFLDYHHDKLKKYLEIFIEYIPEQIFSYYIAADGQRYKFLSFQRGRFLFENNNMIIKIDKTDAINLFFDYISFLLPSTVDGSQRTHRSQNALVLSTTLNICLTLALTQVSINNATPCTFHFCGERMFEYLFSESAEAQRTQSSISQLYNVLVARDAELCEVINIFLLPTNGFFSSLNSKITSLQFSQRKHVLSQYDILRDQNLLHTIDTLAVVSRPQKLFR